MSVITISRQYGSGGDEIADRVCALLGYRHFDKRQIAQAALEAGLSDTEVIDYSEDNHKVNSFLDRLLGRSQPAARVSVWKEDAHGVRSAERMAYKTEYALDLVQRAVKAAYEVSDMVILGRGGQAILKDHPGVLHVRIEAPMEERIQRVKAQLKTEHQVYQADLEMRRAAQDQIVTRDYASEDYIKSYYSVDWADPTLYHLVLNTGKMTIDQAAQIIVEAVHILQSQVMPA